MASDNADEMPSSASSSSSSSSSNTTNAAAERDNRLVRTPSADSNHGSAAPRTPPGASTWYMTPSFHVPSGFVPQLPAALQVPFAVMPVPLQQRQPGTPPALLEPAAAMFPLQELPVHLRWPQAGTPPPMSEQQQPGSLPSVDMQPLTDMSYNAYLRDVPMAQPPAPSAREIPNQEPTQPIYFAPPPAQSAGDTQEDLQAYYPRGEGYIESGEAYYPRRRVFSQQQRQIHEQEREARRYDW